VGNPRIFAFVKSSLDGTEKALILLNKDRHHRQSCHPAWIAHFFMGTSQVRDISPEEHLQHTPDFQACHLKPSGINVLYARLA
jgi:hypothetical protein